MSLALCICTREAVSDMRRRGDEGHVIHVSSMASHRVPGGSGVYSATKFAVRSLTEGLRLELRAAKSKIRVGAISPDLSRPNSLRCTTATLKRRKRLIPSIESWTHRTSHRPCCICCSCRSMSRYMTCWFAQPSSQARAHSRYIPESLHLDNPMS